MNKPSQAYSTCELQSLHQRDLPISTEVTPIKKKSYLRPQGEKHTNTHSRVVLYPCRQWKQTAFPFPLPVLIPPRTGFARTDPTSSTTSATHKNVLFLIFLAFWQKREPEVSGVKEMLSHKKSLPFLAARLPAVTKQ